ncbi:MAG: hypothetical protein OEM02_05815 [Desulfobulbaceae bacterium]|nr:hypothetical protein [Desulfobulbaceae bacterium]
MSHSDYFSDWDLVVRFLPQGWREGARDLGALTRQRKFAKAEDLLRLLLIHLGEGYSMRETVTKGGSRGLVSVSDVALLKRLKLSSRWLNWMARKVMAKANCHPSPPPSLVKFTLKSIATFTIREPGNTGSTWQLHHCLKIIDLESEQFIISRPEEINKNALFLTVPNDLLIGDYDLFSTQTLFSYMQSGAHCIFQYSKPLVDLIGKTKTDYLTKKIGEIPYGDYIDENFTLLNKASKSELMVRICIIRNPDKLPSLEQNNLWGYNKSAPINDTFAVITTLPESIPAIDVLEAYRIRWTTGQALRQLNSLLGLSHLPKGDEKSFHAWFHGKLLVALLAESFERQRKFYSPWGY